MTGTTRSQLDPSELAPAVAAAGMRPPAGARRRARRRPAASGHLPVHQARNPHRTGPLPADAPVVPSLANLSFPASRFEREMQDLYGIVPADHPMPRPLVRHRHWPVGWYPLRRDAGPAPEFTGSDPFPFVTVDGPGVYEIPVGPVHAGLIEPGHFRFSVVGESILKLKARLWFVHRGVEKLFEGRAQPTMRCRSRNASRETPPLDTDSLTVPPSRTPSAAEPPGAAALRGVLLELERLYNHTGDLGALANDVGYGIANAHALRIREKLLRLNAEITGHRLLRGALAPGRVAVRSLPDPELLEASPPTSPNSPNTPWAGPPSATASPAPPSSPKPKPPRSAASATLPALPASASTRVTIIRPVSNFLPSTSAGDVLARYEVRRGEFAQSVDLIGGCWNTSERCEITSAAAPLGTAKNPGVGIVEGWRGTITTRIEITAADCSAGSSPSTHRGSTGRHFLSRCRDDRSRLPARQQELQSVLRRQRPMTRQPTQATHETVVRCAWPFTFDPVRTRLG